MSPSARPADIARKTSRRVAASRGREFFPPDFQHRPWNEDHACSTSSHNLLICLMQAFNRLSISEAL